MKSTLTFVILQYIIGLSFAISGGYISNLLFDLELNAEILFAMVVSYFLMLIGVGLTGFFHLHYKKNQYRFVLALSVSLAFFLLFLMLYLVVVEFIPYELNILSLFIPLSGAIFGFNLIAVTSGKNQTKP